MHINTSIHIYGLIFQYPTGYYGHFRSKSRADFVCEYRQLARPVPPKKFVVRSKVRSYLQHCQMSEIFCMH